MLVALVFIVGVVVGPFYLLPWPVSNDFLVVLRDRDPFVYRLLQGTYIGLWGSSLSLLVVTLVHTTDRLRPKSLKRALPEPGRWPAAAAPEKREELQVVLGAVYDPKKLGAPSATPRLAVIPKEGLFTATLVLAATGWGKTRYVLTPALDQLFAWKCWDKAKRAGGLIIEVKGTFCKTIRQILVKNDREEDYLLLSPGGPVKYNPIDPGMSAGAIAATITNLMTNLFGEDRDKYWSQVTAQAIRNIVTLIRRQRAGHCTIYDILRAMAEEDFLTKMMNAEYDANKAGTETLIVDLDQFVSRKDDLRRQGFEIVDGYLKAPYSKALHDWLIAEKVPYQHQNDSVAKPDRELNSLVRWFIQWRNLEGKIRTSIVTGIAPMMEEFDVDAQIHATFCPEQGDPDLFMGWDEAIESGKVVAVDFSSVQDPNLTRMLGVFIKQAYQRAILRRIPRLNGKPGRPSILAIDEAHEMLTVGKTGFGDDKFLAQAREGLCIVWLATQSVSSIEAAMRGGKEGTAVVLANVRNKIFGATEDPPTAKYASSLCGQRKEWRPSVSISESGQKSGVSVLGGAGVSNDAGVGASKTYGEQVVPVYREDVFTNELRQAQSISRIHMGDRTETMVVYHTPAAVPKEWVN